MSFCGMAYEPMFRISFIFLGLAASNIYLKLNSDVNAIWYSE